jgi:hypothetical protein
MRDDVGEYYLAAITDSQYADLGSLSYFLTWLFATQTGRQFDFDESRFKKYFGIIQFWDSLERHPELLEEICDYHCQRIKVFQGDRTDFSRAPFDLIPFEVLYLAEVRKSLAMPMPEVHHPLLNEPFGRPILVGEEPMDDTLNALQRLVPTLFT